MRKFVGLVITMLLWAAIPAQAQLPLGVQRDLISKQADTVWETKAYSELPDLFVRYRALGKQLPTRMLRMEASVAAKNNDHAQVLKTLEIYFKTAQPEDDFYKLALANYAKHKKLLNAPKVVAKPKSTENPAEQSGIPKGVRLELLVRKIVKAATDKNDPALLVLFTQYRAQNFKMPPRYLFSEAESAYKTNDLTRAKRVLTEYFATGDKTKGIYASALDLYEKIETAEAEAANPPKPQPHTPVQPEEQTKSDPKSDKMYTDALNADSKGEHAVVMKILDPYFEIADVEHKNYEEALALYKKNEEAFTRKKQATEKYGKKRWGKSFGGTDGSSELHVSGQYMAGSWGKPTLMYIDDTGDKVWEKNIPGVNLNELLVTDKGIFVGMSYDNPSVTRLDKKGKVRWHTDIKCGDLSCYPVGLDRLPDGGVLVALQSTGKKDMRGLVARLKKNGKIAWVKNFAGTSRPLINALAISPDGGAYIGGRAGEYPENKMSLWHIQPSGDVDWRKQYIKKGNGSIRALATYPTSGALVGGFVQQHIGEPKKGLVIRIDKNGKVLWKSQYKTNSIETVLALPDGGALLGTTSDKDENKVAVLIRTDANGKMLWTREYAVATKVRLKSMVLTQDGGAILGLSVNLHGENDFSPYAIRVDNVVQAPPKQ